jgi:[acyl-carrier-protein] S-malonyltransferase
MLALLCGGQGLLSPGMFDLVAERPETGAIFAEAGAILGRDPRSLVHGGDQGSLHANHTGQILCVTAALAAHACIADALPAEFAVSGYSVGEMAAWSIAGVWTAATTLRLTDRRARAMDAAGGPDGQLGYVRGLDRRTVERLSRRHDCAIAITDPGKLFVVGGARVDVADLCREAEAAGATRAALLDVRIASHTPRLGEAVAPFRCALGDAEAADPQPGCVLLSGGDGAPIFRASASTAALAARIAHPIDWAATLDALVEAGADTFLDLGPGHALASMARAAFPDVRSYAANAFHGIDGLRGWVASI